MNGTFIFKDKKGKKRKELWKDDNFIKLIWSNSKDDFIE
jgi:hypothetical protein